MGKGTKDVVYISKCCKGEVRVITKAGIKKIICLTCMGETKMVKKELV